MEAELSSVAFCRTRLQVNLEEREELRLGSTLGLRKEKIYTKAGVCKGQSSDFSISSILS